MVQNITYSELQLIKDGVHDILENNKNITKLAYSDEKMADLISLPIEHDSELIKFVNTLTGYTINDITSLHYIKYTEGTLMPRHRDEAIMGFENPSDSITVIFLLKMCEKGGMFFLDDKQTELYQSGQFITFRGEKTYHEVTEIKKGEREVLVFWYKPTRKKSLF